MGSNPVCYSLVIWTRILSIKKWTRTLAFLRVQLGSSWRTGWDSNPRALADYLISSQGRYDHFDTCPYEIAAAKKSAFQSRSLRGITVPAKKRVPRLRKPTAAIKAFFVKPDKSIANFLFPVNLLGGKIRKKIKNRRRGHLRQDRGTASSGKRTPGILPAEKPGARFYTFPGSFRRRTPCSARLFLATLSLFLRAVSSLFILRLLNPLPASSPHENAFYQTLQAINPAPKRLAQPRWEITTIARVENVVHQI